jgi:hypothetical protein
MMHRPMQYSTVQCILNTYLVILNSLPIHIGIHIKISYIKANTHRITQRLQSKFQDNQRNPCTGTVA